jgi:hypothetical protein
MPAFPSRAQVHIPKILKTLEARKLIKAVKSVASKNKKMYMLYDLEPPHEPFYTDDQVRPPSRACGAAAPHRAARR